MDFWQKEAAASLFTMVFQGLLAVNVMLFGPDMLISECYDGVICNFGCR